jgi:hypothetical protein
VACRVGRPAEGHPSGAAAARGGPTL